MLLLLTDPRNRKKKCVVNPGDALYLPAFWYHKVAQADETIAFNWWYDFEYRAPFYQYMNFYQDVTSLCPPPLPGNAKKK